jgi:hypothetical protein
MVIPNSAAANVAPTCPKTDRENNATLVPLRFAYRDATLLIRP